MLGIGNATEGVHAKHAEQLMLCTLTCLFVLRAYFVSVQASRVTAAKAEGKGISSIWN